MTSSEKVCTGCNLIVVPCLQANTVAHDLHAAYILTCCDGCMLCVQLESERQQEAERAAKVHEEMREAHSRLKVIEKELKSLTSNQVITIQNLFAMACSKRQARKHNTDPHVVDKSLSDLDQ